jgi:hypothetical protein
MPRYFCDYCDMYLTKDSAGGRKEHRRGWKHRENVIAHFKPALKCYMTSGEGNAWQGWQNSIQGGQGPPPLPYGWEQHTTGLSKHEGSRPYYLHTATGISTWTHPCLLKKEEMPEHGGKPCKSWEEPKVAATEQQQQQVGVMGAMTFSSMVPPNLQQQQQQQQQMWLQKQMLLQQQQQPQRQSRFSQPQQQQLPPPTGLPPPLL